MSNQSYGEFAADTPTWALVDYLRQWPDECHQLAAGRLEAYAHVIESARREASE